MVDPGLSVIGAGALAVAMMVAAPAIVARGDLPAGPLTLACRGVAASPVLGSSRSRTGRKASAGRAGRSETPAGDDDGQPSGSRRAAVPDVGDGGLAFIFDFGGDVARVRYPAAIVPTIHSGGDRDGWWPIRDLTTSDDAFSGLVVFNFVNKSRFTIDRRTGSLDIRGLQANATGQCAKLDPGQHLF